MVLKQGDRVLITEGGKKLKGRIHDIEEQWVIIPVILDDDIKGEPQFFPYTCIEKLEDVKGGCNWHSWTPYEGFREVYRYCQNCDKKEFN